MSLAVALDLGDFVERLPLRAQARIGLVDPAAGIGRLGREHPAVRQVAVVRQGEHLPAGLGLVVGQPLVEVERIGGADRRLRRQRHHLPGAVAVVAKDDVAVQVVALRHGGPFETDEGREAAGVVEAFGRVDDLVPDRGVDGRAGAVVLDDLLGQGELREVGDQVQCRCRGSVAALPEPFGPRLALRDADDVGGALLQVRRETHQVGMIGDDDPVERPAQLERQPGGGDHFFAPGRAVGLFQAQRVAEQPGIGRKTGVQMRVAPEHVAGKRTLGIGRVALARIECAQRCPIGGAGVLGGRGAGCKRQHGDGDGGGDVLHRSFPLGHCKFDVRFSRGAAGEV